MSVTHPKKCNGGHLGLRRSVEQQQQPWFSRAFLGGQKTGDLRALGDLSSKKIVRVDMMLFAKLFNKVLVLVFVFFLMDSSQSTGSSPPRSFTAQLGRPSFLRNLANSRSRAFNTSTSSSSGTGKGRQKLCLCPVGVLTFDKASVACASMRQRMAALA